METAVDVLCDVAPDVVAEAVADLLRRIELGAEAVDRGYCSS